MKNTHSISWFLIVSLSFFSGLSCTKKENQSSPQVSTLITSPEGAVELKKEDLVVGTGTEAISGKTVTVNYTGWLTDGKKFDSSLDPGRSPFQFQLGGGQVIPGWEQGVLGMKIGGKRKLTIPPHLGYGERGAGSVIPPNSTLLFEVELLGVK